MSRNGEAPAALGVSELCLVGVPASQLRPLAERLGRQLEIPCTTAEPRRLELLIADGVPRLFLLDLGSAAGGLARLASPDAADGSLGGSRVALVSVPLGMDVEPYLGYSDLVGVFREGTDPDRLASGVLAMLAGDLWFPREALHRHLERLRSAGPGDGAALEGANDGAAHECHERLQQLTPREREVLRTLGEGETNEGIARRLGLSVCTVKTHLQSLYRKLEVSNRVEAALLARRSRGAGEGDGA